MPIFIRYMELSASADDQRLIVGGPKHIYLLLHAISFQLNSFAKSLPPPDWTNILSAPPVPVPAPAATAGDNQQLGRGQATKTSYQIAPLE